MTNVSLKEGANLEANGRMIDAGYKTEAIRKRIRQVAQERNLPMVDVDRALTACGALKSRRGDYLIDFGLSHGIDLDWLIYGDIRGLLKRCPGN